MRNLNLSDQVLMITVLAQALWLCVNADLLICLKDPAEVKASRCWMPKPMLDQTKGILRVSDRSDWRFPRLGF
jgi:hypothetical protein